MELLKFKKEVLKLCNVSEVSEVGSVLLKAVLNHDEYFYQKFSCLIDSQKTPERTERPCDYIADFVYYENGKRIVEDCKGMRTDVYKIKRKLMLEKYNISIKET